MINRVVLVGNMANDPELKYTNLITLYRKMSQDEHVWVARAVWRRKYVSACYALAAERYSARNYRGCLHCVTRALMLNPLVGSTLFRQGDSAMNRIRNILRPYQIFSSALLHSAVVMPNA